MLNNILSYILVTPLLGALAVLAIPKSERQLHRYAALFTALVTFFLACLMMWRFDRSAPGIQFIESHPWVESLKIAYLLGVDGVSVYLIPLTALIFLLGVISSWEVTQGVKGFFSLFLLLEATILGTFMAQDLFLFFAFWEASILPVYFMLGVWGHEKRVQAATKFFIFQLAGGVFMLLALLAIYYMAEPHTFSMVELAAMASPLSSKTVSLLGHEVPFAEAAFIMLLLGFAVRIPAFPLHSWYVEAQSEAPVAIAVVLAALFLKTGAYGLLRVNYTLFPGAAQWMASSIATLGIVNILYGALCALGQKDIRKLVAYMCISHMGFVLLGLGVFTQTSFHGALLHMICHGIYASLLVFLTGALGERTGHYNIVSDDPRKTFGGLVVRIPVLSGFFTVGVFAAVGIPGLAGFPPESLVFLGTFPEKRVLTVLALCGLLLTAGYFLWMYRRVFLGAPGSSTESMVDLTLREKVFLTPLAVVCVVAGIYPTPFLNLSAATLSQILSALK